MSRAPRCGPSCACSPNWASRSWSLAEGPGANWSTLDRSDTFALRPEVILTDIRAHAAPLEELRGSEGAPTPVVPWNPEPLYGPRDHARFLGLVADALEAARAS